MGLLKPGSALGLLLLMGACSSDDTTPVAPGAVAPDDSDSTTPGAPVDALNSLYAPERVLEIEVELAAADWELLRNEGRSLFEVFLGQRPDFEFTEVIGAASVDGTHHDDVVVRKKGFLGSLSRTRPSLKLDFGDAGSAARGFERLTLNNNRQDGSHARQCLAYAAFARAGLPAPRCNLAHVVVNGEELGTFTNVEPVRKPLLRRHFSDDEGNLYEGQTVDFSTSEAAGLESKTNEATNDRSDVERLVSALQLNDAELESGLGAVLDIDQFRDFWAMETLLGHWDGYAGNQNNYYVYSDPASGLFNFIPWGTDGSFSATNVGDPQNSSPTVYARGLIANRLYNLPDQRARFRERLAELVDRVWNEAGLVDELAAITERSAYTYAPATDSLRQFLETHGDSVRSALELAAPEWIDAPALPSPCFGQAQDISFEFATSYGDLAALAPGSGSFDVAFSPDGVPFEGTGFSQAGVDPMGSDASVIVRALAFRLDGSGVFLQVSLPPGEFTPGTRSLYALESSGVLVALDGAAQRFVGFISDGNLTFDQASSERGAPVSGRVNARLLQLGCAEL